MDTRPQVKQKCYVAVSLRKNGDIVGMEIFASSHREATKTARSWCREEGTKLESVRKDG